VPPYFWTTRRILRRMLNQIS